jgi:hypothetical protein
MSTTVVDGPSVGEKRVVICQPNVRKRVRVFL